jgi:hypothetical protein
MEEKQKHKIAFKGKPKKNPEAKRSGYIPFKCTSEEKKKIKELAKPLSVSDYVRRAALGKGLTIVSKVDKNMLSELSQIGVNINQIARVLNTIKDPYEIKKFKSDLDTITIQLRDIYRKIR